MKIGVLYSRVRVEEKMLFNVLDTRGICYDRINDGDVEFDLQNIGSWNDYDVILERCIKHSRALYALQILNAWGIPSVNTAYLANICGDKLATSSALVRAGVPTMHIKVAFTRESAIKAIEELGYPVVLKPAVGTWGRLLAKVNDRDAVQAILEHKEMLGSYHHAIFYIQEYIRKPRRDIRAFVLGDETVAAVYRECAPESWIANTARGGNESNCPVTSELNRICVAASRAVGGGITGVDLLEDPERGYLVNEVNYTIEFSNNTMTATGVDIPNRVIDYVLAVGHGEIKPLQRIQPS